MTAFNLQVMLASEMVRVLGVAGEEDPTVVRHPENAMKVLREQAPTACSSEFCHKDRVEAESLALKMFFSIFWGETLDVKCDKDGSIASCKVELQHCHEPDCCGPTPVWQDWLDKHEPKVERH